MAQLPRLAWDNAAHSLLERTLDDSANRRSMLPEAFLVSEELVRTTHNIFEGLQVDEAAIARNLQIYGPFAATERVLMALVKNGADRQVMHTRLRELALTAWAAIQAGEANPLIKLVVKDPVLKKYAEEPDLRLLMQAGEYVGDASQGARAMSARIRAAIRKNLDGAFYGIEISSPRNIVKV